MRRREFLRSAAGFAAAGRLELAQAPKPNLLFLLAGGWRGQALAGADPNLRTPQLERLAKQSVQFDRFYVACPASAPSRASLITGRYPHTCGVKQDGVQLPLDQPSMARQLKDAGYRTGYAGEWRLDGPDEPGFVPPGPRRRGFDYWAACNRGQPESIYFRDTPEPIRAAGFGPDDQTDRAIEFLKQGKMGPFCLFLAWTAPRPPRRPPARTLRLYDPGRLALRPNVPDTEQSRAKPELVRYYALCSALDENIGRLLAALDVLNLSSDTIVVFTSDHGDMLGSQGLEGANVAFEESVRAPLLMRYPRLLGSRRDESLVSNVDLMPTLLGLCGAAIPDGVQGRDLSSWIATGQGPRPESVYSAGQLGTVGEWRMLVRGLDKLVADRDGNVTELYNLGQDPYELDNLARDPSQELKRDELKALMKDWMRRTGDRMDPSGLKRRG